MSLTTDVTYALIGAAGGALVSIIAVALQNRHSYKLTELQQKTDQKLQREERDRERLTDLYLNITGYFSGLVTHYMPCMMVMRGEIDYNQALDLTVEMTSKSKFNPDKVHFLSRIYYPTLVPEFERILRHREALNAIVAEHKEEYKAGINNGQAHLDKMAPILKQLTDDTDAFELSITEYARQKEALRGESH